MTLPLRFLMSEATAFAGVVVEPSVASLYVNLAYQDIAIKLPHQERETLAVSSLSSGENRYNLPTDCDQILNFSFLTATSGATGWPETGNWGIRQANVWEIDSQSGGTFAGPPRLYVQYSSWLELYPSPDSSYSVQLRYLKRFSDLTNLESTPSLATRYHPAVMLKAAELLAERQGDLPRAAYLSQRFLSFMGSTPDTLADRQRNRNGMGMRLIREHE